MPKTEKFTVKNSIWVAKCLRGGGDFKTGDMVIRKSLKEVCEELGFSYRTAMDRQDKDGGITVWVSGVSGVWDIWRESVK